jgi:hypothetical protein
MKRYIHTVWQTILLTMFLGILPACAQDGVLDEFTETLVIPDLRFNKFPDIHFPQGAQIDDTKEPDITLENTEYSNGLFINRKCFTKFRYLFYDLVQYIVFIPMHQGSINDVCDSDDLHFSHSPGTYGRSSQS